MAFDFTKNIKYIIKNRGKYWEGSLMPLQIVRNDITKMKVDAIVNSTNRYLEGRGTGVDGSIHAAAGAMLQVELDSIGYCEVGNAVITKAYNITGCKFIIHTVGPKYIDGEQGETELLESCYRNIFRLAAEKDCRSIAIPTISSGYHGFPKETSYEIAASQARLFLKTQDEDMMIYLVVFSDKMKEISENRDDPVKEYITEGYRRLNRARVRNWFEFGTAETEREGEPDENLKAVPKTPEYLQQDLNFAEMCMWWIKRREIKVSQFYVDSNITKSTFWAIKNNPKSTPKKTTAFAICVGLKLEYDEATDLLRRAGLAFSEYYDLDKIVEYFISRKDYNIDRINLKLWNELEVTLGTSVL